VSVIAVMAFATVSHLTIVRGSRLANSGFSCRGLFIQNSLL
jgi:hypothetical protein